MSKELIYSVDSKPPFITSLFLGFQHVLTLWGSTTLVPLLIGNAMNMSTVQLTSLIGCVYLGMGICTLLQTSLLGSRLPLIQSSSFSFLVPFMAIISLYITSGPNIIMQYIGGGLIVGGILQAILGYSGIISSIKKIITPVVIAPTIMAIGFSLANTAINSASTYWPISICTICLILFFSLVIKNKNLNIFSILLSICIMYLVCLFLSVTGLISNIHPAFIDISKISNAYWFKDINSVIFPWGLPKFDITILIILLSGFIAGIIESIGDYHSISYAANLDNPDKHTISKGIGSEGLGMIISGIFGSMATTTYTENIGLVNLTKIASRYVVQIGAVLLILLSFIGKFSAIVASMPTCILGACYIVLFALIGSSGISIFSNTENSQRNLLIVGIAFLLALGLPTWIEANKEIFVFSNVILNTIGNIIYSLFKSSMAVAAISSITMDSIIPKE